MKMQEKEEQQLLASFRLITDMEDRRFHLANMARTASRQVKQPRQPILRLVVGGFPPRDGAILAESFGGAQ